MDYEKKYNKLVEAIKVLQETNPSDEGIQNWVNDNVPELKESEDEKIRRELISCVNNDGWKFTKLTKEEKESWIAWLEKQSEQKPVDVVEPKFKVGDWITNGYCKCQITFIDSRYWYSETCVLGDVESIDKKYHLWTIEDAKDGDVLVAQECYVIFKEIDGLNIKCYCTYHYMGFNPSFRINTLQNKTAFHPATKEQCDILFQKMKEAGYEWDCEKKELKMIEEEYDGEDYGIDSLFHAQRILEKTLGKVDGYQSDDGILSHKCAISAVKQLYEKKSAEWSEEDEHRLKDTIYFLDTAKKHYASTVKLDACIDWLKSLKKRMEE